MEQPVCDRTLGCLGNQEKEPLRNPGRFNRKRAEGKRHNAAVMCLAGRRLNVLFAMVKHGVFYETKTPAAA